MKRWVARIIVTLALAAIVHVIVVKQTPYIVSSRLEKGILERVEINTFEHNDPRSPGPDNKIPQSNPDFLPSILVYDVSKKPLRIHLAVPGNVPYWSFSLFADNIDNYYVLNDRSGYLAGLTDGVKEVDLVLVGPEATYFSPGYTSFGTVILVKSPTSKGFGLIRMIVEDRYSVEGKKQVENLKKVQRMSFAEPAQ
jgi:uncharacterized membrane protein